jgi:hypothetical protein
MAPREGRHGAPTTLHEGTAAELGSPADSSVRHRAGAHRACPQRPHCAVDNAMTRTEAPHRPVMAIAARVLDLARDGRLSLDDGADHLRRLGGGEHARLEAALAELPEPPDADPAVECGRRLLHRALAVLTVT